MMSEPYWPKLREFLMNEIGIMRDVGMSVRSKPNPAQHAVLTACNLEPPENREERMEVYDALCAVVSFMTKKMNTLEFRRTRYLEQIQLVRSIEPEPKLETTLKGS